MAASLPLRVAFCGSPAFAAASLEALLGRPDLVSVVAVVTQPDKPAGRKRQLTMPPVKALANLHALPVLQWRKLRDGTAERDLRSLDLDLLLVAAYGRILPAALLAVPRLGCMNVHASLLPAWRGASPIQHALLAGDAHTGVSLMMMDEGLDTGPVVATRALAVAAGETGESLTMRLAALGAALLCDSLAPFAAGRLPPVPQPSEGVSHAVLLDKAMGQLDFRRPAAALERQVRAFCPWPGAYVTFEGERVAVLSSSCLPAAPPAAAGVVVEAGGAGLVVACGEGSLRIERVKPAGRKEMTAAAWIAGRGPKMRATLQPHEPAHADPG